ncbi:MAG TPA: bacterioferritin [Anaerolineaceae bacterium]|jgi:bacterioferritin|nr:bacterioferritin [Anaerolineaceae bacterium]
MKGNEKVLETLNGLLREELTAISQYMVHAEMYEDWGYSKLGEAEEHSAIQEMKHAEKLISRILFLEGRPIVSELNPIHIGKAVDEMLKNDLALETDAVKLYNDAIKLVIAEKDNGTKELLDAILADEEGHVDFFEEQLGQIEQMTLPFYLSTIK